MAQGTLVSPEFAPEQRDGAASDYRTRADRLRQNFDRKVDEGAYDKASECLWGWFAGYVNALAIIRSGSPIRGHRETELFAEAVATEYNYRNAAVGIAAARNMHRNFYHGGPRGPEELADPLRQIAGLVTLLDHRIREEVTTGVRPGAAMPARRRLRHAGQAQHLPRSHT